MMHVGDVSLNMDERSLLCEVVNHLSYATNGHPYADDSSIAHFTVDFCIVCLDKALQSQSLTSPGQFLALTIKSKLRAGASC